jgi:hypothetical protein
MQQQQHPSLQIVLLIGVLVSDDGDMINDDCTDDNELRGLLDRE